MAKPTLAGIIFARVMALPLKTVGLLCGVAVFLVISICILVMAHVYHEDQKRFLDEELRGLAAATALLVDGDLHNSIRDPEQMKGADYAKAVKPLTDIHNAFPRITYLYTMIEKNGEAYFILDTAADPRLRTKKTLEASSVMEKYEKDPAKHAGWLETLRAGKIFVDPELVTDEYGTFKSGSAPFYDSQGKYAGFVGVDYDAALFLARERQIVIAIVISLSTGFLLSVLIGVFVWRLKRSVEVNRAQRERAETELVETSTLLQTALGSIDQGFLVWDNESRVVVCNDRYHELWGYPKELLKRGTPLIDLLRYRAGIGAYGEGDAEELAQAQLAEIASRRAEPAGRLETAGDRVLFTRHFSIKDYEYVTICTDFTELSRLQEALQKSEAQLRAIFDNTPICLNLKDAEGRYLLVNKPYEKWLGFSADEIIGKKAREFMGRAAEIEGVEKAEKMMLNSGEAVESTVKVLRPDGQYYDRILIKFPVKAGDGTISGIGSAAIDISELKRTERALLEAKETAEVASRTKSEFLAHMSHELRTPLNSVIGFSEMLEKEIFGPLGDAKYQEYARDIHASGTHLLSLINDILDISKIEAGELDLMEASVDVGGIIVTSTRMLTERAERGGITLGLEVPQSLPRLRGDELRLKQILINLLSNAIKFTPKGGQVTIEAKVDDSNAMVWKVVDTGVGIAAADLSRVLRPFEQARDNTALAHEGTGLGLYLSTALTELHDGTLEIESEVRKGTTVTVKFPPGRTLRSFEPAGRESPRIAVD